MSTSGKKIMKKRQLDEGRRLRQEYFDELGISSDGNSSGDSSSTYKRTETSGNYTGKKAMKERQLDEGRRLRQQYLDGYRYMPNETMAPSEYLKKHSTNYAREYAATKTKQTAATKASSRLTYSGKQGNISYVQAQKDPGYKDYVRKGSQSAQGYSDGFIGNLKMAAKVRGFGSPDGRAEFLNADEKDMYNYLLGKYGKETAREFEQSLGDVTAARLRDDEIKNVRDASKRNIAAGIAYNSVGALESPKGYIYAATKMGIDKAKEIKALMNAESTDEYKNILEEYKKRNTPVDTNNEAFSGNAIMNASNQGIKDAIGGTPVRDFAIDTGLSITQAMSRLPLGPLNVAVAGGSAATDAYVDAAERGATGTQALAQGAAQGTAEGAGEAFSLGKLKALKEVPGKGARTVLTNLVKQGISEGSEEAATEIMNSISDKIIMGDKSNYDTSVRYYKSLGLSDEEAKQKAYADIAGNVGLAALGGATSGVIMGGGAQALGNILQRNAAQEYARQKAVPQESLLQEEQTTASQTIPDILPEENTARQQVKEQQAAALENTAQRMIEGVTDPVENTPLIAGNVSDGDAQERSTERTIQANEKGGEDRTEFSTIQNQPENAVQEEITPPTIAKNTESIQNRENMGPQYIQPEQKEDLSAYAREYAVSPQEAERQSYIESHREDLNDIFSDLGEKGKKAAVEQYDPDIPISQYRQAFNVFYDAGRYANDITPAEKSAVSVFLSGTQQVEAYKAGARDRLLELEAKRQVKKGETREGGFEDRSSNATDAQRKLSESLGKRTGLKFVLEDSLESGAVGEYEGKTGTIRISTNSENFLRTNSHELTHFIKENAPESYASYRDAVISAYLTSENQTFEKMVESYERAYEKHGQKLSRDEIMEEITADATGKFWNDEEFVRKIASKDKTVAQKIVDFLSDMLDAIKSLIKNEHTGRAAEMLAEQQELFEDARNRWMDALDQASENYKMGETSTESAVRFQLAKPDQVTDKHIEENYDYVRKMDSVASIRGDEFKGDPKEMRSKIIELYNSYGNVVHNDVVGDVALSMRSVRNDLAHGYGDKKAAAFATVKDVIENGKVLRYSKDWKGRGYDSVSIGAKINITDGENAGQYYEVCVIKVDRTNRMYLHEVDIEKADSVPFNYAQAEPAKKHSGYNYLPISSIFDRLRNVKNENVKYQLGDNELEETDNKELVARNDLTEEKLVESLDMNSPISLKTKPGKGGEDMGGISIVFKKDAVASGEIQKGNFKDGVAAVILPTDASDNLKARLNQEGINTILYDPNLPDARKKAISELKDVRFQIDDSDMDIDYDEVVRENSELRKINEELKNQLVLTKDYVPRQEDIRKYARRLLKDYNSTYPQKKLEENLSRFYDYIHKAKRLDAQETMSIASQIGHSILEKSQQVDTEQTQVYRNILNDIKGTPIYVPEEVRNNLDSEGGYSAFRKKYFGKITFRNSGVSVDVAYNELSGLHPDLFPADIINPTDQLLQIADVLDESRPKVENPYGADIDEMSVMLGQEILDNKANIRNIPPTLADKLFARADEREAEYILKRKEYEQKLKEYRGKVEERERGRKDKKQIVRDVTKMQKWLLSPTDRDHVPESMRTAVTKFLSCIDYSSSRLNADGNETQRTRDWNDAKKVYDSILKSDGLLKGEKSDMYIEVDPDLVSKLDELQSMADEGRKLEDLSAKELRTLKETVSAMKHSIEDANKMYTNKRYEKASEAAESTLKEWQGRKNKKTIKVLSAADKFLQVHMLDSFTAFDRLGDTATSVYQSLRDGFDTKMRDTRTAQEYMENLKDELEIEDKEIQEWTGNKAKRQTFKVSGGEISLTPAQVMSLYCLDKRPQAREHLYNQLRGIRTQGVEREVKIKGRKLFKVVEANVPVTVTPSDVHSITETLTPKQKALADGIVKFFTDQTAQWGNDVSMTLYGYKKFNAQNYFPIVVDKNEIAKTNADVGRDIQTLKNLGITKNTTKHAKNSLIIEDIFDVYTRQADQMGSYHSFVVPMSDFQKYYNFNDVEKGNLREQMERVYGKEMSAWMDAFLKDLNGVGSGERELTSNFLRNAKSAAVGWNLRTAIQQPTAYFRAAAEIDPKYLAQGIKLHVSDAEWDQVKNYAPIAWWKDLGFFDINTGRSMKSILIGADTVREKMINKSMDWAGKGDELAWKRLWLATKAETAARHPELTVNSEEFLQKSGERFSEIIDKTQVVDSVFHRSWAMRENWTKFYTSFMSEPIKSYNMLYRAAMNIADSKELNGKAGKAEKAKFARVAAAYASTGIITALVASVMDVVRNDDDDKDIWEKYIDALGGNIADNLNVLNLIPIAKDVVSMFGGNSSQRMDLQGIEYAVYACNEMKKFVAGESKYTPTGILYKWMNPLSRLTGIPIGNLLRDAGAVVDTALDITEMDTGDYWKTKRIYDMSNPDNVTMYTKKALKAYREGKGELGGRILSDLIKAGQTETRVDSAMKTGLKNEPLIQEAADAMLNWDLDTYESKIDEVASRGIDKDLVVKAVDTVINKKKKELEGGTEETQEESTTPEETGPAEQKEVQLYDMSNVNEALAAGENEKANQMLKSVVESKKADGKTQKEVISSVKSSLTSKYKKKYLAAGADERANIEIRLEHLRVDGRRVFSSEDFSRWRKNSKKK